MANKTHKIKALPRFDIKDGGYKSRKFWITIFTMGMITGTSLLATKYSGMASLYGTLVGGLVSCLALFLTGNVAQTHLMGRNIVATAALGGEPDVDVEVGRLAVDEEVVERLQAAELVRAAGDRAPGQDERDARALLAR